jgi:hypothetical protein
MLGFGRPVAVLLLLPLGCMPPSSLDPCGLTSCTASASSGTLEGSTSDGSGSTGDDMSSGTDTGAVPTTATGDASTTSGGGPEPVEPPQIVSAVWTPNPITEPGKARLEVVTEDADDIVAWLGDQPFALTPVEPGSSVFVGEFTAFSELSDGTYTIDMVATRGPVEGEAVTVDLKVDLPQAGTEALWDAGPGQGVGLAGTILPGPDGDLFEFGTDDPANQSTCALRRRNADGKSGPNDVITVQPGKLCTATDAAVDIDGTLLLLSEVTDNGETLFQLDRHDPWNHSLVTEIFGTPGMKGNAVTVGPAGQIIVCGSTPDDMNGTDMAIRGENPKITASFDLDGNNFAEVANDCTFVGNKLVLAGDAFGQHPPELDFVTRHTTVEIDLQTKQAQWNVAKAYAPFVNSSARAITADDAGGYITAGHVCEKNCFPQIELRQFTPSGNLLTSYRATAKTTSATGIAWHPAGYVVVTAAEIVNVSWSRMWVQAWIPGHPTDLWTYSQSYTEGIHMALDVAVGQSGWIHFVGIAELGGGLLVPAFVTLNP